MPPSRRDRGRKGSGKAALKTKGQASTLSEGRDTRRDDNSAAIRKSLKHTLYRIVAVAFITLATNYLKDILLDAGHLHPWKVVDLPGRGKGMIATRLVKRGERILTEQPLFIVPRQITGSPTQLLKAKLDEITAEQRTAFYELSHADSNISEEEIPLSIFQTNGIAAGPSDVGIFPKTARLNHGCSAAFNSVYSWREKESHLVVHALKDIQPGEELLTAYFDTKKPRDARRAYLAGAYKFNCSCAVCSLPEEASRASDMRLQSMTTAMEKFVTWVQGEIDGLEALDLARKAWHLGEEEGYWSERGQLAADAVYVAVAHSDEQATRKWAALAHEWFKYEVGEDSEEAKAAHDIMDDPKRHIAWGSRQRMIVGDLHHGL